MKIIFEDGREVETENPVRELVACLEGRPCEDYIFVMKLDKPEKEEMASFYITQVLVYFDGGYHWIRNWWDGYSTIKILCIGTLNDAGDLLYEHELAWKELQDKYFRKG